MVTIVVVCEGAADFSTGTDLADREICRAVSWVEPEQLSALRSYQGLSAGIRYLEWTKVDDEARAAGIRARGHFDGQPAQPDARAARRAIRLIVRRVPQARVVILLRDSDGDLRRKDGLQQAASETNLKVAVVIGLAHCKREAWVVSGFEPRTDDDHSRLEALRQELGFDPRTHSHALNAKDESDKRSAKRVLRQLCDGDSHREAACWRETSLEVLAAHGRHNGLEAFLAHVQSKLVPLIGS
jgi:hypothetical protein